MRHTIDYRCRLIACPLILLIITALVAPARAQEEQLEPEPKKPAPEKKVAKKPAEQSVPQSRNPAVRTVLDSQPSTPAECLRAAKIMADLNEPRLCKMFLGKILAAKPDQKQLADLAEKYGSGLLIELAGRAELLPEAKQLAEAVLAAVNQQLQEPKQLAEWVRQLHDASPEARYRALASLRAARGAAVGPLLDALADGARAAEHVTVRVALATLGEDAVGPLLGTLEKCPPALAAQSIQTLAEMNAGKAAIYLMAPYAAAQSAAEVRAAAAAALKRLTGRLPSKANAVQALVERAQAYFDRRQPIEGENAGELTLWRWDADKKQCVSKTYAPDDASRALAARLARDAFLIAPEDQQVRVLYAATMLEEAACQNGLDKPLEDDEGSVVRQAAGLGTRTIEGALAYAIAHGHPAAATVAAQILGRSDKAKELLYAGSEPTPLVRATQHADRRLRMAAVEAIVRLKPERPFAGSGCVTQTLAFFAASRGTRRALAAGPNTAACRDVAGLLAASGVDVDTATSGRDLFRLASTSPDYELAFIDVAIDAPTADLLVQQLRRDCRTADLRVGLLAQAGFFEQAERIAQRYARTLSFARPRDEKGFQWQIDQLSALAPQDFVGYEQRQRQAAQALDLLAELSSSPDGLYDLRSAQDGVLTALYNPQLGTKAVAVLENLGTPASQRALVELASRFTQPLELRQAAAAALGKNIGKHGILLTTVEIRRQYERYNQSATLDAGTQQVLGTVLDSIEAPTQAVKKRD